MTTTLSSVDGTTSKIQVGGVDSFSFKPTTGIVYTASGANAVTRSINAKLAEVPFASSDYSVLPTVTSPNSWYWDYTNPDGAGQRRLLQTIPNTVNMTGGAAVQGMGMFYQGSTSAQTPNAGLAETNMIRIDYTVNSGAGSKVHIHTINSLLTIAADEAGSGTEHAIILGTARATGPTAGTKAMGIWGGDFHVEKTTSVLDGSMVGLEVGVHKAPALSTSKCYGIHVWSGDRSVVTGATAAGDALHIDGSAGWTNFLNFLHTDSGTNVVLLDRLGNLTVRAPTGSQATLFTSNQAGTNSTLSITGVTAGSVQVTAVIQAATGGQVTLGATTNHEVVGISNNIECIRLQGAGLSVGGTSTLGSTFLTTTAGTTAKSSLRVPHGAAPTSPVNGDMWTTTAGLFVRINGATVGPLT